VELVEPPEGAAVGERLRVDGYDCSQPDEQLNPKKKVWEAVSVAAPCGPLLAGNHLEMCD
jgi:hypothetical protein